MKTMKPSILIILSLLLVVASCSKEYYCEDCQTFDLVSLSAQTDSLIPYQDGDSVEFVNESGDSIQLWVKFIETRIDTVRLYRDRFMSNDLCVAHEFPEEVRTYLLVDENNSAGLKVRYRARMFVGDQNVFCDIVRVFVPQSELGQFRNVADIMIDRKNYVHPELTPGIVTNDTLYDALVRGVTYDTLFHRRDHSKFGQYTYYNHALGVVAFHDKDDELWTLKPR